MGRIIRRWTDEEVETIRSMHAAGKPQYVIANKVGRSIRSVQKIIAAQKAETLDSGGGKTEGM